MGIALIIVNYGTGALVLSHLPKIRAEIAKVPGSHLFIVDNASPNNDGALLENETNSFEDVTVIRAPRNGGFSYGNNLGFSAILAENYSYLYLLNPDAYPLPGCLETLKDFLEARPEVGAVGSRLEGEDGSIQVSAFRFFSIASEFEGTTWTGIFRKLLNRFVVAPPPQQKAHSTGWLSGASILFRREVIENLGPMDEHYFLYFEEVDYQLAAKKAGYEIWYEPTARAVHLVGQSTDMKDGRQRTGVIPAYWYDSRLYYFTKNHGPLYALGADIGWVAGKLIRALRWLVTGKGLGPTLPEIRGIFTARGRKKAQ